MRPVEPRPASSSPRSRPAPAPGDGRTRPGPAARNGRPRLGRTGPARWTALGLILAGSLVTGRPAPAAAQVITTIKPPITSTPTTAPATTAPATTRPPTTAPRTSTATTAARPRATVAPTTAPATPAPTQATIPGGTVAGQAPAATLPLAFHSSNGHVSPVFAWLSVGGAGAVVLILGLQFLLTRPSRDGWTL